MGAGLAGAGIWVEEVFSDEEAIGSAELAIITDDAFVIDDVSSANAIGSQFISHEVVPLAELSSSEGVGVGVGAGLGAGAGVEAEFEVSAPVVTPDVVVEAVPPFVDPVLVDVATGGVEVGWMVIAGAVELEEMPAVASVEASADAGVPEGALALSSEDVETTVLDAIANVDVPIFVELAAAIVELCACVVVDSITVIEPLAASSDPLADDVLPMPKNGRLMIAVDPVDDVEAGAEAAGEPPSGFPSALLADPPPPPPSSPAAGVAAAASGNCMYQESTKFADWNVFVCNCEISSSPEKLPQNIWAVLVVKEAEFRSLKEDPGDPWPRSGLPSAFWTLFQLPRHDEG